MTQPGSRVEAERGNSTLRRRVPNVKRDEYHHKTVSSEEILMPARVFPGGTRRDLLMGIHSNSNSASPEPVQKMHDKSSYPADWDQTRHDHHFHWHKESQIKYLHNNVRYSNTPTPRRQSVPPRRSVVHRRTARGRSTSSLRQSSHDTLHVTSYSPYRVPLIIPDDRWPFKINSGRRSVYRGSNESGGSMQREKDCSSISPSYEEANDSGILLNLHRHSLFVYDNPEKTHEGEPGWRTFVSTVFAPPCTESTGSARRTMTSPSRVPVTRIEEERHATPNRVVFGFNAAEAVEVFDDRVISPRRRTIMESDAPSHHIRDAGRISHRPTEIIVPERVGKKRAGSQRLVFPSEKGEESQVKIPTLASTGAGVELPASVEKNQEEEGGGDAACPEANIPVVSTAFISTPVFEMGVKDTTPTPLSHNDTNELNTKFPLTVHDAAVPIMAAKKSRGLNEVPSNDLDEVSELHDGSVALGEKIAKSTNAYASNGSSTLKIPSRRTKPLSPAKPQNEPSAKSTTAASLSFKSSKKWKQDTGGVLEKPTHKELTSGPRTFAYTSVKKNNGSLHMSQRNAAFAREDLTCQALLSGGTQELAFAGMGERPAASSEAKNAAGCNTVMSDTAADNGETLTVDFPDKCSGEAAASSFSTTVSWPVPSCPGNAARTPVSLPTADFMVRCLLDT
ncbi:hypothetical protein TraAM80_04709 [Trypanosoma rangeli]|uniref:Uncharacterized protein n=1 Tax=Trypanosoma rangeli TaxID=5698 RepID=A0A3R7L0K4_TRYRA|nr:uncharacterized protein TraAM80_04709 [Trypanosoma rangeli]RNF05149.1 hypothetical protein TraAM80_04709 [Trypanosoma rangeli]|eukprot:RNF05149.1 hypothetical protein TraAM80_04709 [Trypanosoma rangeli]